MFFRVISERVKLIPIHKSGSKLDENNYRPYSRLMVLSKIFERVMCNRFNYYFEKLSFFIANNSGFAKNIAV